MHSSGVDTRIRNSSERDDLLTALVVQKFVFAPALPWLELLCFGAMTCTHFISDSAGRGLRLQISVASLDPSLTNVELTPERALYARVPCPVFVFTKIGKKMHATLGACPFLCCYCAQVGISFCVPHFFFSSPTQSVC